MPSIAAQSEGRAFETPEALLGAVGLHDATQRSLRADLQVHPGSGAAPV